jgi:uncharacterized protein YqjF (DUF2071 family)
MDAPAVTPSGQPRRLAAGFQRWRSLLFVHWEVSVDVLRPRVPPALEIDTYQGKAYVGLIPFDIPEARVPPVPGAARFLETNLRTYVRLEGTAAVWFFSLDAESTLAVLGARAVFGLPYHRARMSITRHLRGAHYTSRRHGRSGAALTVEYELGDAIGPAVPGTLEHFLVERYSLFAQHPLLGLRRGDVRHHPYPLRTATMKHLQETLTAAAGLGPLGAQLPALYSEGVDVDISPPLPPGRRQRFF